MTMLAKEVEAADRSSKPKPMGTGQDGVALLTVMMIMLILTVLGIAAITTTGLENRMAGFARTGEEAATAADSCLGVGANLIRQALIPINSMAIPPAFLSNAVPPGPVPLTNAVILHDEIYGIFPVKQPRYSDRDAESRPCREWSHGQWGYRPYV